MQEEMQIKKKKRRVEFVNHNYIWILCAYFFIWIDSEKLMEFHVMFFQSAYIWLTFIRRMHPILLIPQPTKARNGCAAAI